MIIEQTSNKFNKTDLDEAEIPQIHENEFHINMPIQYLVECTFLAILDSEGIVVFNFWVSVVFI